MSAMASPPPAIRTATSTNTRPVVSRSCVGVNPRRAIAADRAPVRPTWLDSSRVATFPACATTRPRPRRPPTPWTTTDTTGSRRRLSDAPCVRTSPLIVPLCDRHFRVFRPRVGSRSVNGRGAEGMMPLGEMLEVLVATVRYRRREVGPILCLESQDRSGMIRSQALQPRHHPRLSMPRIRQAQPQFRGVLVGGPITPVGPWGRSGRPLCSSGRCRSALRVDEGEVARRQPPCRHLP